jgi:hypothetical protein
MSASTYARDLLEILRRQAEQLAAFHEMFPNEAEVELPEWISWVNNLQPTPLQQQEVKPEEPEDPPTPRPEPHPDPSRLIPIEVPACDDGPPPHYALTIYHDPEEELVSKKRRRCSSK